VHNSVWQNQRRIAKDCVSHFFILWQGVMRLSSIQVIPRAMTRYALYFTPQAGPFSATAARWLGRSGDPFHADLWPLTTSARRYGFHATLKAPFRLTHEQHEAALITAMTDFAVDQAPVALEGLRLANLDGFLALIPVGDTTALDTFAARVVRDFDRFRAPLTEADISRRNPAHLSPRQRTLLDTWGYPYVMEEFRFHMTLTDRLDPAQQEWVLPLAESTFANYLQRPMMINTLTLCVEGPDAMFHSVHRTTLTG
jgi:hypothetical protein